MPQYTPFTSLGGFGVNPGGLPQGAQRIEPGHTPANYGFGQTPNPANQSGGIPWLDIANAVAGGLSAYGQYRQGQDALKVQQEAVDLQKQKADEERQRRAAADPIRQQVQQMILQRIAAMTGIGGGATPPMPQGY